MVVQLLVGALKFSFSTNVVIPDADEELRFILVPWQTDVLLALATRLAGLGFIVKVSVAALSHPTLFVR